jgi:nitrous oxidase accessory protein NosD
VAKQLVGQVSFATTVVGVVDLVKKLLVFGIILLMVGVSIPSAGRVLDKSYSISSKGITLYVGGSGPGNYTNIQQAVNNSQNGDTVFVYNGTYYENVQIINKSISLIGEDRNTTVVINNDTVDKLNWIGFVFEVYASDVMFKGFTIREGTAGIHYWGKVGGCHENLVVSDCNFINNKHDWGGMVIRTWYTNNTTIENCYFDNGGLALKIGGNLHTNITVSNCFFNGDRSVIRCVRYVVFSDCKFYKSTLFGDYGNNASDYLQFYNCTIDSPNYIGIDIIGTHQTFENCTFINCLYEGIQIAGSDWAVIRNCIFKDGRPESKGITFAGVFGGLVEGCIMKNLKRGIYLHAGRKITIKNCHFENNKIGFLNFQWSIYNRFIENNFINNNQHFQNDARLFANVYENNYWDDWDGTGSYRVLKDSESVNFINWLMSFLNWDKNPAQEPYDI